MEEQESKQPQIPEPNKTPKRVVRTYQADLAKMSKDAGVELSKEENKKPEKKKKGLVTPPKKEKKQETPKPVPAPAPKEEVVLEETNLNKEEKTHYVEEIQTTDSIDLDKELASFTKEDLDHVGNLGKKPAPPAPKLKPLPQKPLPKKAAEPIVVTENASAPKQNIFGSIMSWLLEGGSEGAPQQAAEPQPKPQLITTPPKKLREIPVVPNVAKKEMPTPAPAPFPEPKEEPAPLPKKEIVLPGQQEAPKPSGSLFAPPAEKKEEAPAPAPLPKPESAPEPIAPPLPPMPREEFKTPSPIATYTSDARKGIKEQKDTPLSVLAKQQDAKKAPPKRQAPKKSSLPVFAISITLLVLGVGAVTGAYFFLQSDPTPVTTPQRVVTPVFAENRTKVSATKTPQIKDLTELISLVSTPGEGSLTHVTFQAPGEVGPEIIPFSEVLLASNEVPGALARSAYPQSMLGIYGTESEPVVVLAVTSFERSFKSLLSWESDMPQALAPLYGALNRTQVGTSTPPYIAQFIDEEIETTDARILYDAVGDTHLIYGFPTPNILFITKTKDTFIELTDRIVRE
ncbi:MAG: hypothetical protein ACJKSS_00650 [Patescibacteria group bacterium UBA2103]